eukprot:65873_1
MSTSSHPTRTENMRNDYKEALFALHHPPPLKEAMAIWLSTGFFCHVLSNYLAALVVLRQPSSVLFWFAAISGMTLIVHSLVAVGIACRYNFVHFLIKLAICKTKYMIGDTWDSVNRAWLMYKAYKINVKYTMINNECVICKGIEWGVPQCAFIAMWSSFS